MNVLRNYDFNCLQSTSACERMIKRDIARTFPDHSFFKDKDGIGQGTLFNVIKVVIFQDKLFKAYVKVYCNS